MKNCDTNHLAKWGILFGGTLSLLICFQTFSFAQSLSRVQYANKDIFLSGINVAWVNFAGDLGPNPPSLNQFRIEFQTVRDNGGNALRLWLHTNGSETPEYNSNGYVTGPGPVAIQNLKQILALAHQYDVGLILCLWSFDMLRTTELDSVQLYANKMMLTDTSYTMAYVRNALMPMVDSVKDSPAIIAWEVCNEPNGMTTGLNYNSADPTVSTFDVERFTNLIAGGIHRADPSALVTTGPGSFQTLTDVNPTASAIKSQLKTISSMSPLQLHQITAGFNVAHRLNLTDQQMLDYLMKVAAIPDSNDYRDDRLVAAGGDTLGKLDFYCVHYYNYGSTALSPFTHQFAYWGLTKPTVVAEFYMQTTDGMQDGNLFPTLHQNGYAGALVWSWTDFPNTPNNMTNAASDTWAALRSLWSNYQQDVMVFGATWPTISIANLQNNSSYPDSTRITVTAAVIDTGATMSSVDFFSSDSSLGKVAAPTDTVADTLYYSLVWNNIPPGTYTFSALATNSLGQQDSSTGVQVSVGKPPMTRLSVRQAIFQGTGITLKTDPTASGGYYLDIAGQSGSITWQFVNHDTAGSYLISFGYNLHYDTPKWQYIYVNGTPVDTLDFDGATNSWQEKTIAVNLVQDTNSVQMQLSWGWMYLDYLGVPTDVVTAIAANNEIPDVYSLSQNYPNPFNPTTILSYQLPKSSLVTLKIYDVLGREVETLVNTRESAGKYSVTFDASRFASGVYFYNLRAGSFVKTGKMLLLK